MDAEFSVKAAARIAVFVLVFSGLKLLNLKLMLLFFSRNSMAVLVL
jgi:hypothetical protein